MLFASDKDLFHLRSLNLSVVCLNAITEIPSLFLKFKHIPYLVVYLIQDIKLILRSLSHLDLSFFSIVIIQEIH